MVKGLTISLAMVKVSNDGETKAPTLTLMITYVTSGFQILVMSSLFGPTCKRLVAEAVLFVYAQWYLEAVFKWGFLKP